MYIILICYNLKIFHWFVLVRYQCTSKKIKNKRRHSKFIVPVLTINLLLCNLIITYIHWLQRKFWSNKYNWNIILLQMILFMSVFLLILNYIKSMHFMIQEINFDNELWERIWVGEYKVYVFIKHKHVKMNEIIN